MLPYDLVALVVRTLPVSFFVWHVSPGRPARQPVRLGQGTALSGFCGDCTDWPSGLSWLERLVVLAGVAGAGPGY